MAETDLNMQRILATDLDGTLIPLADHPQHIADLRRFAELVHDYQVTLAYVTGRHLASVQSVRHTQHLPDPEWIICDVGTSLYRCAPGGEPALINEYAEHLHEIVRSMSIGELSRLLDDISGVRLQEREKQGRFKLSYYADASRLKQTEAAIQHHLDNEQAPYSMIVSIDPFNGDGLIDLLPKGVSKAYGLAWWTDHLDIKPQELVFAGDSGNDLAPLTTGYRSIIVGNAPGDLVELVRAAHAGAGWEDRLLVAQQSATSGVLEGARHFGLFG